MKYVQRFCVSLKDHVVIDRILLLCVVSSTSSAECKGHQLFFTFLECVQL